MIILGKCEGGLVSREFDAIYVELDAVLEPALTLVNGQTKNRVGLSGKNRAESKITFNRKIGL